LENFPATHGLHWQPANDVAPTDDESVPALQAQDLHGSVASAENRPALHVVHMVAPAVATASVTDPDIQIAHCLVGRGLYSPAAHIAQVAAPGNTNVFVTAPAGQTTQARLDKFEN
jgi:hypothetical protein